MKRLTLKKLIVISQSESKSLEVPFSAGLNIILGPNKTGKSSIIKSIFTSLGCDCPKIESDWKKLISTFILFFEAGVENYCVMRIGSNYSLFQVENDGNYICLIDTSHFHEFSNRLMDVLQVRMPCIDKNGKEFNITPPLLLRFQYIDQDEGWSDIGVAFQNMRYIKKWRENTNKYICGYLGDEYYDLVRDSLRLKAEIDENRTEYAHNESFVNRIGSIIDEQEMFSPTEVQEKLNGLLSSTEQLRRELFNLESELANVENTIFISKQQLKLAERNQEDNKKDANYAMSQGEAIVCPVCGMHYDNGLEQQLHIATEYATAENLVCYLAGEIRTNNAHMIALKRQQTQILETIQANEEAIQTYTQQLSYRSYYHDEGKRDVYRTCLHELEELQTMIDKLIGQKGIVDSQIKDLKSPKRAKEIRDSIIDYCGIVADQINLPRTFIKLKDFVQVVDKSGSDTPRLVYMYHIALYLYNLKRLPSPFNFLVIDTPNQQGQDESNLKRIFEPLELLQSTDGQVILGTERETGYEGKAANVIRFNEPRRCLTSQKYDDHINLVQELHELSIKWVHDTYSTEKATL